MGILVALEGIDGAGKRTLTAKLVAALRAGGASVATAAFPRYHQSIHADLAAEALRGRHGDLARSIHGMAMMFALDRAGAIDELTESLGSHDVLLLDRYTASNAAYGAARLHQDAAGEFVEWLRELEFERLGLPVPSRQILLRVSVELAAERACKRAAEEVGRERDAYERDGGLQARTGAVYTELAASNWVSPWMIAEPDSQPAVLAARLLEPFEGPRETGSTRRSRRCSTGSGREGDNMGS